MFECEIVGPVDALSLIVAARGEPEMQLPTPYEVLRQEDEASIDLGTVGDDCVDLGRGVLPDAHPFKGAAARIATDDNYVASTDGPLALHSEEMLAKIEDEVVSPSFLEGSIDVDPHFDRCCGDLRFGNRSLPIC
jgi:hypothetical protein